MAQKDPRESSPHFKDGKFRNPVHASKSFWEAMGMFISTDFAKWPDEVPTPVGPIPRQRVDGDLIRVTHITHSTVLIQTAGYNILTDPIYSERCSPVSFAGPKRVSRPGVPFEQLPKIDVVIISHDHYDHLDLPTLKKLIHRDNPEIFAGLGVASRIEQRQNTLELDWWQSHRVSASLNIHFVPVQHFSGRGLFDRNSTLWGGYVLEFPQSKIYFGGDSGYADHYVQTFERFGPMDLALLPIGAYSPRDFMAYAHMDPFEAVQAHIDLRAKKSIGIHYGTFRLTAEPIDEPLVLLERAKERAGLGVEQFMAIQFGQPLEVRAVGPQKAQLAEKLK